MKNRKVHLSFMNYLSGGSLTSVVKHTSGPGPKPGDSRRRSQSQVNVMHESTKGEGKEVSRNRQRIWSDVLVRDYDDVSLSKTLAMSKVRTFDSLVGL